MEVLAKRPAIILNDMLPCWGRVAWNEQMMSVVIRTSFGLLSGKKKEVKKEKKKTGIQQFCFRDGCFYPEI